MPHKGWWLLLVLLLAAVGWWFSPLRSGPDDVTHSDTQNSTHGATKDQSAMATELAHDPITTAQDSGEANTETSTNSETGQPPIPGSDWQEKLLQELSPRLFSDDPFVEIRSLEYVLGQCRDQDVVDRLFVGSGPFYQAQQDLAQTLQQQCQHVRQQYPEYFSYPDHEQLAQAFAPTSRLGQMLQQLNDDDLTPLDRTELSSAILTQSIKERNGATLLDAVFVTRFGSLPNQAMAEVLGSRDHEYINQMSSLALMLLSCQFQGGRSCEPTSFYMIAMCSQTPGACGLDFPSWLELSTLPGMRRDIDRLVAHFSQYGS
ncbi:hypothetical protein [Marinicella meishanensis]|uniref:hypothetical protein n=1 Tax=Marinicella meishanensis TaxID=2873263 RepID=UPI001CC0CDD6|nr:hypothetical protein [Marinicella sp. NBU2979]